MDDQMCPLCGKRYAEDWQFWLHCGASEKGYLPDCGLGAQRKATRNDGDDAEAA